MEFTVDRAKWRCGGDCGSARGRGTTKMLNAEGFMCCLGHCGVSLGATGMQLLDNFGPMGVAGLGFEMPGFVETVDGKFYCNSDLSQRAMDINDDSTLSDEERERSLAAHFAAYGHELEFIGEFAE